MDTHLDSRKTRKGGENTETKTRIILLLIAIALIIGGIYFIATNSEAMAIILMLAGIINLLASIVPKPGR